MKVLITGATGLIGGRLIEHLLESGDIQIRAASRRVRANLSAVEWFETDLNQPSTLRDACQGVDAVINLASMGEKFCSQDPLAAMQVNGGGALTWSSAAESVGVPRFIQVSTSKVYGNNPFGKITEESHCKPQTHYAITHRLAEDYVSMQHSNSVVLRLANGFGAPTDPSVDCWGIIVNQMCRQAVLEKKITIQSSGQSWRNFIPMQDIVRALHFATFKLPAGTYNLGASYSIQLHELAVRISKVCAAALGFTPTISTGTVNIGEEHIPLDYCIQKLSLMGFNPNGSLEYEVGELLRFVNEWRNSF